MSDAQVQDVVASGRSRTRLDDGGSGSATVTVACKLPNGLVLTIDEETVYNEPLPSGGFRAVKQFKRMAVEHTVKGSAINFESIKRGMSMPALEGGFALTSGIPKDFWDKWWEQHKDADYVRRGLIFATGSEHDTRHEADKRKDVRGLDPIDPDNPGAAGADVRMVQVGTTTAE